MQRDTIYIQKIHKKVNDHISLEMSQAAVLAEMWPIAIVTWEKAVKKKKTGSFKMDFTSTL